MVAHLLGRPWGSRGGGGQALHQGRREGQGGEGRLREGWEGLVVLEFITRRTSEIFLSYDNVIMLILQYNVPKNVSGFLRVNSGLVINS